MSDSELKITTMGRNQLGLAIDWAAEEGWNPGLHDDECFYAADPGGFLVGSIKEEPVAVISAVRYGKTFGFLGFFMVRADCRGRKYGLRLGLETLSRLVGRTTGLDGVVAQQENYRRAGFMIAHRNIRYEGVTGGEVPGGAGLIDLAALPFQELARYDRPFFPDDRSRFLKAWITQPQGLTLGTAGPDGLDGYGVIRKCRKGYKIGPLFADNPDQAERIFRVLVSGVDRGEPVYLDLPEPNREALALAERFGMKPVFETARMYAGGIPQLPLGRIYGITSFELG